MRALRADNGVRDVRSLTTAAGARPRVVVLPSLGVASSSAGREGGCSTEGDHGDRCVSDSSQHSAKQQRAFRRQARTLLSSPSKSPAQAPSPSARGSSVSTAAFKPGRGVSVAPGLTTSTTASTGAGSVSGRQPLVADTDSSLPGSQTAPSRKGGIQHFRALVLDTSYRPVNVVPWSRAVMLDVSAKAEVLDYYSDAFAISGRGEHPLPAVMRVHTNVNLSEVILKVACTRRNIMVRDKFTCAYCGARRDLTLDHIVPVSRGGQDTWSNLVTACSTCNQRKGNQLLQHLGWRLRSEPREPTPHELGVVVGLSTLDLEVLPEPWGPYLQHYLARRKQIRAGLRAAGVLISDSDDEDEAKPGLN